MRKRDEALIVRGDGNGTRFGSNAEYSLVYGKMVDLNISII